MEKSGAVAVVVLTGIFFRVLAFKGVQCDKNPFGMIRITDSTAQNVPTVFYIGLYLEYGENPYKLI